MLNGHWVNLAVPPDRAGRFGREHTVLVGRLGYDGLTPLIDAATGQVVARLDLGARGLWSWYRDPKGEDWLYNDERASDATHWSWAGDSFMSDYRPMVMGFHSGDDPFRVIDLDDDGVAEVVRGTRVWALDGTLLADGSPGHGANVTSYVDVTGDGRREIVSGAAIHTARGDIVCEVDPGQVTSRDMDGPNRLLDLRGTGEPMVLVSPGHFMPSRYQRDKIHRVQTLDCQVVQEIDLRHLPDIMETSTWSWIVGIAPMVRPDRPAILIYTMREFADQPGVGFSAFYLLDHHLNLVDILNFDLKCIADLDGDGVHEVLGSVPRDPPRRRYEGLEVGFLAYRGVDRTLHKVVDMVDRVLTCTPLDADGDLTGELILTESTENDGPEYVMRAIRGAGEPWAPSWTFNDLDILPYLYTPDGEPARGPVDWGRYGMFNATPSSASWHALDSDLVVRIYDVCDNECVEGWLTVWAQVGNQGRVDADRAVRLDLFAQVDGQEQLVATRTFPRVPRGSWLASAPIRLRAAGITELRAVVSGDGYHAAECDTTNNEDTWEVACE